MPPLESLASGKETKDKNVSVIAADFNAIVKMAISEELF